MKRKWGFVIVGIVGLACVYLLQRNIQTVGPALFDSKFAAFTMGRFLRFILNDVFVILMIYGLFPQREYVIFAIYVQVAGVLLILMPYLILKYFNPGYNGPLISFLHRLVLNPLLMLMLIPAFYLRSENSN